MNEILDFLVSHWQLSVLMTLVLAAYAVFEFMQQVSMGGVTPEQAVDIINHKHGIVIDVRTPEEFRTGHILGSIHFDGREPDAKLKRLNKYAQKPVVVVCAHGKRSATFLKRLQSEGFSNAVTLDGGLHAWQNSGLPLATGLAKEIG